jgi:UDP-N-acetylglucosamine 1-carboxyvinyltransferase
MDRILIEGGSPLKGSVRVSGAKNAALPVIAACLLTGGWHHLKRIPNLRDVHTIKLIMSKMGVVFREENGVLAVNSENLDQYIAAYDLVKTMRASILLLGPLLARLGRARISLPGGCAIGARPVDLHLKALGAMGVEMFLKKGYINAEVKQLKGAEVFFDIPTVTGTENIMMTAVRAKGQSVLRNAAKEPEVQDLADMLRRMGAEIEGDGTDTIVIRGRETLVPVQEHEIIADRIESGTFMIAAAMTRGDVHIEGCRPDHVAALTEKLQSVGAEISPTENGVHVKGPETVQSVDIETRPFPGFPTDLQAQFMSLMCIAKGSSIIRETIFENRFIHVSELKRLGADIAIHGNQAMVRGKERLLAAPVMATDLRASASLILAGLVAQEGVTEVNRIYHLDRGYEVLEKKFQSLGAKIWREKS